MKIVQTLFFIFLTFIFVDGAYAQSGDEIKIFVGKVAGRYNAMSQAKETAAKNTLSQRKNESANARVVHSKAVQAQVVYKEERTFLQSLLQDILATRNASLTPLYNKINAAIAQINARIAFLTTNIPVYNQNLAQAEANLASAETAYNNLVKEHAKESAVLSFLTERYNSDGAKDNWLVLAKQISETAAKRGINSNVTFTVNTTLRNGTIKFQRVEDSQEHPITTSPTPLTIGYYYFWLERNNQPVSERKLYSITNLAENVVITERAR